MRIWGWGFCIGFGQVIMGSKLTNLPLNSGLLSVQMILRAATRYSIRLMRVSNVVPWSAISSAFQPAPMPRITRPLDN